MEEKERYELFEKNDIIDTEYCSTDAPCSLMSRYQACVRLNQQDKRIKELEEENNFLEKRNEELMIDRRDICLERNDIFEENQQLKQQLAEKDKEIEYQESMKILAVKNQNQKAIEQLEKVKDYFIEGYAVCKNFSDFYWNFTEQIDNQINGLKGDEVV